METRLTESPPEGGDSTNLIELKMAYATLQSVDWLNMSKDNTKNCAAVWREYELKVEGILLKDMENHHEKFKVFELKLK